MLGFHVSFHFPKVFHGYFKRNKIKVWKWQITCSEIAPGFKCPAFLIFQKGKGRGCVTGLGGEGQWAGSGIIIVANIWVLNKPHHALNASVTLAPLILAPTFFDECYYNSHFKIRKQHYEVITHSRSCKYKVKDQCASLRLAILRCLNLGENDFP